MTEDRYVLPSSDEEAERLERQSHLYGGPSFLRPFLADKPRRVLDVGCGTGFFTRLVANELPEAEVVGLDMDAHRLAYAKRRSAASNLRFEPGRLPDLPFASNTFDLVYARFVLLHFPDPVEALREMARVTRPGGRVIAYDMVHEGVWFSPDKPAFAEVLRQTVRTLRDRGLEPNQGLHLAVAMKRAGIADVRAEVVPHCALGGEPLFEAYRANWASTLDSLEQVLGTRFDEGLIDAARAELAPSAEPQLVVEITVLTHGVKTRSLMQR